jgi:hypothetical protein
MRIELNIGLNISGTDNTQEQRDVRAQFALNELAKSGSLNHVLQARRATSSTEDTLIVECRTNAGADQIRAELFELSELLGQDCIAVYNATSWTGELVGPDAAAWGEFNPDYFLRANEHDGRAVIAKPKTDSGVTYTGHGAKTGGLQGHSVGDEYPYIIIGVADRWEAPTEYQVMDSRTGNRSVRYPTYMRAYIELTSLRTRNMMHG